MTFFALLLIVVWVVWVIWGICVTLRGIHNALVITDQNRVYASSRGQELTAELKDIMRVYIERPIWGKIFGYGSVTIYADGQSAIAIKNVANPEQVKRNLENFDKNI